MLGVFLQIASVFYSIAALPLSEQPKTHIEMVDTNITQKNYHKWYPIDESSVIAQDDYRLLILKDEEIVFSCYGKYQTHLVIADTLMFVALEGAVNVLYSYSLTTRATSKQSIPLHEVAQMMIWDNGIAILGSYQETASFVRYDISGQWISQYQYPNRDLQKFCQGKILGNQVVFSAIKRAEVEGEDLENVGNYQELKTILIKFDWEMNVIDVCYFNEGGITEIPIYLEQIGEAFQLLITCLEQEKFVQYQIASDFKQIERSSIHPLDSIKQIIKVVSTKSSPRENLYVKQMSDAIYFEVEYGDTVLFSERLEDEATLLYATIIKGELLIYYNKEKSIKVKVVKEYHVNRLTPLYCNRLYFPYETTDHFDVDSYLEPLQFSLFSTAPHFFAQMSGTYEGTYRARKQNGEVIDIVTPIIVESYVNIMDDGVYPIGYSLIFFGEGILNGAAVYSGTTVSAPGEYTLKITDINLEFIEYHFIVRENAYAMDNNIYIPTDLLVEQNMKTTIAIPWESKYQVEMLVINGAPYPIIEQTDDTLAVTIYGNNYPSLDIYHMDSIFYTYFNQTFEKVLHQTITVRTLKRLPTMVLSEAKIAQESQVHIEIDDIDRAILAIILKVYQQNQLVFEQLYNPFNGFMYLKNLKPNILHDIQMTVQYERGDGVLHSIDILKYTGLTNQREYQWGEMTSTFTQAALSDIYVKIAIQGKDHQGLSYQFGTKQLIPFYEKTPVNRTFMICMLISCLFGSIILGKILWNYTKKNRILR